MSESENTQVAPVKTEIDDSPLKEPVILASKVCGVVKWFSVKSGYGFISTPSSNEDVFVHSKRIKYNNPRKLLRTLAEGETVEFDIMEGEKGHEAINVTGPDGHYVQGSQFAANKPRYGERRSRGSRGGARGSDVPAKRKRRNRKNRRRGRKSSGSASESKTDGENKENKDTKAEETSDTKPTAENKSEENNSEEKKS